MKTKVDFAPFFNELSEKLSMNIHAELTKRAFVSEALTQEQATTAFVQAVLAGDFIRHVRVDNQAQQVIYMPYAESEEQISRIRELTDELIRLRDLVPELDRASINQILGGDMPL